MNSIKINGKKIITEKLLINLFLKGVAVVKPSKILKDYIYIKNKEILITCGSKKLSYKNIKRILPICVGKGAVETAETVNLIFKKKKYNIEKGVLVVNKENFKKVPNFKSFTSGHPLPNKNGIIAAKYIVNYLKNTHQEDLVLIFISGGGSSLLPYPVKNVSLTDKITVNKYLLESGANIDEINTVRKHLSQIKGGNLAKFCFPARVHSLILSDVVGDNVSSISSGLTVPDPSTFNDSKNILLKYNLWKKMPKTIINHIKTGIEFKELETPKNGNKIFKNSSYTIIGSNTKSLEEIRRNCIKKDIKCKIWKKNIEGDVREVAKNFVLDLKIKKIKKPMILISGGETTLQVKGSGLGGRNQEFALYFINRHIDRPNYSRGYCG